MRLSARWKPLLGSPRDVAPAAWPLDLWSPACGSTLDKQVGKEAAAAVARAGVDAPGSAGGHPASAAGLPTAGGVRAGRRVPSDSGVRRRPTPTNLALNARMYCAYYA